MRSTYEQILINVAKFYEPTKMCAGGSWHSKDVVKTDVNIKSLVSTKSEDPSNWRRRMFITNLQAFSARLWA
jgi:hypothetical protein